MFNLYFQFQGVPASVDTLQTECTLFSTGLCTEGYVEETNIVAVDFEIDGNEQTFDDSIIENLKNRINA